MSELDAIESFASDLIASLEPAARNELARRIALQLRGRNQKRIADQVNPDGTAYAPRKQQLRHQKGKIKRAMFSKLRTAKYLKATGTPDAAIVAFTAEVSRIARVHHLGLRDRVNKQTGLEADYPARELIGIPADDEALVAEIVTAHLADRL
jgi:phage virion morphogenesis protein